MPQEDPHSSTWPTRLRCSGLNTREQYRYTYAQYLLNSPFICPLLANHMSAPREFPLLYWFSGLVALCFVAVLPLGCARFGQPMADPAPPPEAVGAGSGLMIDNDESPSILESASGDRVGSNDPPYDRHRPPTALSSESERFSFLLDGAEQ